MHTARWRFPVALAAGGALAGAAMLAIGALGGAPLAVPSVVAVVTWVPLVAWSMLAAHQRWNVWNVWIGLVLLGAMAGAVAIALWPPVDWTIPLGLHIAAAYGPATALGIALTRIAQARSGTRPAQRDIVRAVAWLLLAASCLPAAGFTAVAIGQHKDLRTAVPEPLTPARGELLPLPAGLVIISETTDSGSQWGGRTYVISGPADTPERVRDHLQVAKGWRELDSCRPLRFYTVPTGTICLTVNQTGPTVTVDFRAAVL